MVPGSAVPLPYDLKVTVGGRAFVEESHRPVTQAWHQGDRYFGATAFDASESRPVPFAFVAATVNE